MLSLASTLAPKPNPNPDPNLSPTPSQVQFGEMAPMHWIGSELAGVAGGAEATAEEDDDAAILQLLGATPRSRVPCHNLL